MPYDAHRLEQRDANGRFEYAGVCWYEPITERYEIRSMCFYWSLLVIVVLGPFFYSWYTSYTKGRMDLISFVLLAAVPIAISIMVLVFIPPMSWFVDAFKGVIFTNDTSIEAVRAPGLLGYKRKRWDVWDRKAWEITSIEMRPVKTVSNGHYQHDRHHGGFFAYQIEIYFFDGIAICVGETLSENAARYITAQLNIALQDACGDNSYLSQSHMSGFG